MSDETSDRLAEYVEYYRVRAAKYDGSPLYPESSASEHALLDAFESASSLEDIRAEVTDLATKNAAALVRDQERARADCYDELEETVRAQAPKAVMAAIAGIDDPIELVNAANRARSEQLNVEVIDELVRTIESDFTSLEMLEVWARADIPERWRAQFDKDAREQIETVRKLWSDVRTPEAHRWDPKWKLDYDLVWATRHRRRIPLPDAVLQRRLEEHTGYGWV